MRNNSLKIRESRIRVSVRELADKVVQQGHLKGSFTSSKRALQGTLGHQALQRSRGENYRREISISHKIFDHASGIDLEIHGRIDGVFQENEVFTVEEIKTTHRPIEEVELQEEGIHFTQAKLYGYLFAEKFQQQSINVNLTYYQLKTEKTKVFSRPFTFADLETFFNDVVDLFLESIRELYEWREIRNDSISKLSFPFPSFRIRQQDFINEVAQAISQKYNLFAQAPTGLGKTISVLFPAIKAIGNGECEKVFYLTARTTTREAPEQALDQLRSMGLRLKSISITAKEKTCLQEEMICNPDYCEYLFNYFGKINKAIRDIFSEDHFHLENIESCARKNKVCPFELSLDLSVISDCIICDYNYFYDPRIQLARYESDSKQPFVYLVDEAHNLVERSRSMFSAAIEKKDFLACKRLVNKTEFQEIHHCLTMIDSCLLDIRKNGFEERSNEIALKEISQDLIDYLVDFVEPAEVLLTSREPFSFRDALLELFYGVSFFLKIYRIKTDSDSYAILMNRRGSDLTVKLLCLDASELLKEKNDRGFATVFFSATLTPPEYYLSLLGGNLDDRYVQIPSPFPPANRCISLVANISTRYKDREATYEPIAEYLSIYLQQKKGNYLVFFPSYRYLEEVYRRCQLLLPDITLIRQDSFMKESERQAFIAEFCEGREKTLAGFVVMGGIFGESIDLPGDRLTGAAIVGVGLPQINLERNLIKHYHDNKSGNGFHFAYTFPGLNKVLQAAGRLIRTETDKGSLLLIDDRFGNRLYQRLFPAEWNNIQTIRNHEALGETLDEFWQ